MRFCRIVIWGTRTTKRMVEGAQVEFKTQRWNAWASEAFEDKVHLADKMRVKMEQYVVKYFEGERERAMVLWFRSLKGNMGLCPP